VFLTADISSENIIPFFLKLSRKICFTAVNHLANITVLTIFKAFKEIYQYYLQRGFHITVLHVDGEFAPLKTLIETMPSRPIMVNLASANEHVPEIERRIRVVKERCRSSRHNLPFQRIPKLLTTHIVFNSVRMLNFFPEKGGILDKISPKTIMSGEVLDYKKHLCLPIGQYCQVHKEETPRNSQAARTRGAISLGPSGNLQGGYKFMALNTGKKITRHNWDVIPMPDLVIARVNALRSDQPELLTSTGRHGRLIGDVDIPGIQDDYAADGAEFPGVDPVVNDDIEFPGVDPVLKDDIEIPGVDDVEGPEDPDSQEIEVDDLDIHEPAPAPIEVETAQAPPIQPGTPVQEPVQLPELWSSTQARTQTNPGYVPSLTGSKYSYAVAQLESHGGVLHPDAHMFTQHDFYQSGPDVVAMVMTQLSPKAGLKTWGDKAHTAARNEMKQLHMRDTFKPGANCRTPSARWCWSLISFSKTNETERQRVELWPVAIKSAAILVKRMQARRLLLQSQSF
jgi:hypothetical protein